MLSDAPTGDVIVTTTLCKACAMYRVPPRLVEALRAQGEPTRLRALVERITYKPNYALVVAEDDTLHILRAMPNSLNPQEAGIIRIRLAFTPEQMRCTSDLGLIATVRSFIHEAEIHEMHEFFRVDGELLHDPHKEV